MNATWSIASGWRSGSSAGGAIAVVELCGAVDAALDRLGLGTLNTGQVSLRKLAGVDTVLLARTSVESVLMFPHAGPVVMERLGSAMHRAGVLRIKDQPPTATLADSELFQWRLHDALRRASSALAIDLLLEQPARWARAMQSGAASDRLSDEQSAILRRLVVPPLVVALGPPNIGKSSLLNALAGRSISIVADEAGTTRDHVGAMIDLAGLLVRFVDAPGIELHPSGGLVQVEAQAMAMNLAAGADLILSCGDRVSGFLPDFLIPQAVPSVRIGLRSDVAGPVRAEADAWVSVRGELPGLADLVSRIRDQLVDPALLASTRAWTFWPGEGR